MSQTVYAYQDVNRVTKMVDTGDINYTGTWSSSGTYFEATKDVVLYGSSRFIAIVDNVGGVPTYIPRRGQAKWSSLVVIRQGTETGHTADEAWNLANTANNAAAAAQNTANLALAAATEGAEAYDLAVIGTNAAAVADSRAATALQTAWSGTSGANGAMSIAVAGTNAAQQARNVANTALSTAWAGTAAANTLFSWFGTIDSVDESAGSQFVVMLRDQGTNYANTRDAVVASNGTSYVEILAGQTIRQANLAYAGTTVVDFNGRGMLTVNLTGNVVFDAVNMAAERYCSVRVLADSGTRTLGFHGSWRFLGQKPSQINANKVGVLSLSCFGATSADVLAAWGVEQ